MKEPNRERLREERLRQIEAKMMDVIRECKELGVPLEELSLKNEISSDTTAIFCFTVS